MNVITAIHINPISSSVIWPCIFKDTSVVANDKINNDVKYENTNIFDAPCISDPSFDMVLILYSSYIKYY
jgi:hypothetical protein